MDIRGVDLNLLKAFDALMSERAVTRAAGRIGLSQPAKSAGIFTAGMAEYAEVALVGRLARAFAEQAPRATLRLLPLNGADAADQLERGMIDVAVAHLRALPTPIESQTLLRDPFVVIVRKG